MARPHGKKKGPSVRRSEYDSNTEKKFWRASLETLSGEAQLKKSPYIVKISVDNFRNLVLGGIAFYFQVCSKCKNSTYTQQMLDVAPDSH